MTTENHALLSAAARRWLEMADQHFARGDLKSCRATLERASEAAPQNATIRAALAGVHFQLGEFQEARQQVEQAVQLDPAEPSLLVQLATTCETLQDRPAAESALQLALILDPDHPQAHGLLARLRLQERRFREAASLIRNVLRHAPDDTVSLLVLAKCEFELGHFREVQRLFDRVLILDPGNEVAVEGIQVLQSTAPFEPSTPDPVTVPRAAARNGEHDAACLPPWPNEDTPAFHRKMLIEEARSFLKLKEPELARRVLFSGIAANQSEDDLQTFRSQLRYPANGVSVPGGGKNGTNGVQGAPGQTFSREPHRLLLTRVLVRAIGSVQTKSRVLRIMQQLEPDKHLLGNIRDYEAQVQQGGAGFETIAFLNWYAHSLRPVTYLEIGVRRGRSIAQVLVESPGTQAFGFDLWVPQYAGEPNPGPEFVTRELLNLGVKRLPAFWVGRSQVTVPLFLLDPSTPEGFELINVDGDHSYEGAREDLQSAFARLANGGAIVFDDITHPSHADLMRLWEETKQAHPDCLFFEDLRGYGTGVALKPPLERIARVAARQILACNPSDEEAERLASLVGDQPWSEPQPMIALHA